MKKHLLIVMLILIICLMLSGCNSIINTNSQSGEYPVPSIEDFVGNWTTTHISGLIYYYFKEDGTYQIDDYTGLKIWEIKNDKIYLIEHYKSFQGENITRTYNYSCYLLNENAIYLYNDNDKSITLINSDYLNQPFTPSNQDIQTFLGGEWLSFYFGTDFGLSFKNDDKLQYRNFYYKSNTTSSWRIENGTLYFSIGLFGGNTQCNYRFVGNQVLYLYNVYASSPGYGSLADFTLVRI